jgi:predicted pyridoxine 5'-phosphate oxidase superfamily flavin-nucleotide-binding protein
LFMVPGANVVVRVNGIAKLTADAELRAKFEREGKQPATVIVIRVAEVYVQCARALMRAKLWQSDDESAGLPRAGDFLVEATQGAFDGETYEREWPARAAQTLW